MKAVSRFCSSLTRGEYSKSMRCLLGSSLENFFHLPPAQLGQRPRARAGLARVLARRRAVHHALGDALQDARRCGTGCRPCSSPRSKGRCPCARCACSSARRIRARSECRAPRGRRPRDAAELARRDVPAHAVVGEIRERVRRASRAPSRARRGCAARSGWKTVLSRRKSPCTIVVSSPAGMFFGSQSIRLSIASILSVSEAWYCLVQRADLARDVVARPCRNPRGRRPCSRSPCSSAMTRFSSSQIAARSALRHAGQRLVPQHAALDAVHDVEGGADDRLVLAQHVGPRHREAHAMQRLDHLVLAVDRVRRGQELAGRLAAQRIALAAGGDAIGRDSIGRP